MKSNEHVMRFAPFVFFSLIGFCCLGQSLASLNLNYWYDPNAELEFIISPVKLGSEVKVYYQIITNRKENPVATYSIAWENRASLADKTGTQVVSKDSVLSMSASSRIGYLSFLATSKLWYITAKVTNLTTQEVFHFYKPIDPQWPVNNLIAVDGGPWLKDYVASGTRVSIDMPSNKNTYVFQYKTNFATALPPFAESGRTDPFLAADSVFLLNDSFIPKTAGLYLLQDDTTSIHGVSILVAERNYPKYGQVSSLAGPLVYICTDEEFSQLAAAKSDKAAFDKVILEITRDKERAKNLMRSYFSRVEMANRYFTEYKPGWKTDRGMIYIIYGKPDELSRTATDEVWFYRNQRTKFVFNKSGSVFCPENYKLQRDNNYTQEWFSFVDLWRKSRF